MCGGRANRRTDKRLSEGSKISPNRILQMGGRRPKGRYCCRCGKFLFSGKRELKESHDSQGQRTGHVGAPAVVEGGVVESRGEAALRSGLRTKLRAVGSKRSSPWRLGARHRRLENWLVDGGLEFEAVEARRCAGLQRVWR
jgi:hypothetical protein